MKKKFYNLGAWPLMCWNSVTSLCALLVPNNNNKKKNSVTIMSKSHAKLQTIRKSPAKFKKIEKKLRS